MTDTQTRQPEAAIDLASFYPTLPFGRDENGSAVAFDPHIEPHLVIVGSAAGSAIDALTRAAVAQGSQVYLISARGEDAPQLADFANGLEAAEDLVQSVHTEVRVRTVPFPVTDPDYIYVIADHLDLLQLRETVPSSSDELVRFTEHQMYLRASLDTLVRVGPAARVHLIVAAPDLDSVSDDVIDSAALLHLGGPGRPNAFFMGGIDPVDVNIWAADA